MPRTVVVKPPTSPTASVQSAISSACCSTMCWAPLWPPASSSAVKQSTTGRFGWAPARARARTTESAIASKSFMSTAPRPQTKPSWISPANGSIRQSSAAAGTTSRWPCSSSGSPGPSPHRATSEVRPGSDS